MTTNQIEYEGYVAAVEIDRDADLLRADVINIDNAILSACGRTVSELERSLEATIELYKSDCAADGEPVEEPKALMST
ncbi:MAG: hypothetical protein AAGL08_12740 [Cyanobacteria bacterium J06573_11]